MGDLAGQAVRTGRARWVRALITTGCGVLLALCAAGPAAAAPQILTLVPGSIRAGFSVEVRATCGENANPAFVHSGAFGSVTLTPNHGLLSSDITIPPDTAAGTYTVTLACASGQHSTAKLTVINPAQPDTVRPNPHVGPATGGGETSAANSRLTVYGGLAMVLIGAAMCLAGLIRRRRAA